jgi:hypothetical protein
LVFNLSTFLDNVESVDSILVDNYVDVILDEDLVDVTNLLSSSNF